jgi:hypothetical protein
VFLTVKGVPPVRARRLRRSTPIIAAVALLLAACDSAGSSGPPAGASAADTATAAPTVTTVPSVRPPSSAPSTAEPPPASLGVDGGDPVVGQLGSFTWDGAGSDSPWLPGAPVTIGTGEGVTVTLASDPGVAGWTARRVAPGVNDGAGSVGLGQGGATTIAFASPPSGTWSVQVTIQFANGRGSAAYYWQVTVH